MGDADSDSFGISNCVKQGGVISPLLFSWYLNELFLLLKETGMGCHVELTYAGSLGYADDIAFVAPYLSSLKYKIFDRILAPPPGDSPCPPSLRHCLQVIYYTVIVL